MRRRQFIFCSNAWREFLIIEAIVFIYNARCHAQIAKGVGTAVHRQRRILQATAPSVFFGVVLETFSRNKASFYAKPFRTFTRICLFCLVVA